jgi:hypothetical protein
VTPEQKSELLAACQDGNDVRIITVALQVAAGAARRREIEDARKIRGLVDDLQLQQARRVERRRERNELARAALIGLASTQTPVAEVASIAFGYADAMLAYQDAEDAANG